VITRSPSDTGCRGRREGRKEKFRSTKKGTTLGRSETNLFTAVDAKIAVTGICKQVSGTNTRHGRQDFAAAGGVVGSCILAVAFFFFCLCLEFLVLFRSRFLLTYLLSPGSLLLHSFASSSSFFFLLLLL
jgi:hypothetical protein